MIPADRTPEPLVALARVSKAFGATAALSDVDFEVRPGEVHVLAGANGAGKSTLVRLLCGHFAPDRGEIRILGVPVRLAGPQDAARRGIAVIHQELSLIGAMSVTDNLLLTRSRASLWGWLDRAARRREAQRILREASLDVDPDAAVETLPLAVQQLLEIGRALGQRAHTFVMDEPTSALAEADAERLFARIRSLTERGCGVVYISHRLPEIEALARHITILRDGRVVRSGRAPDISRADIVGDIARPDAADRLENKPILRDRSAASERASAPPAFEVRAFAWSSAACVPFGPVSFTVARGEIVGVTGLAGAGATDLLPALFGARGPLPDGRTFVNGAPFCVASPAASLAAGVVYLPGDRRTSAIKDLDLKDNATLCALRSLSPFGVVSAARARDVTRPFFADLRVVAPSIDAPLGVLSGGNQQKVIVTRGLVFHASPAPAPADPPRARVLFLDDPMRGVDVGAKRDIAAALARFASEGGALLLAFSEVDDAAELCDRVIVLCQGRVTATLDRDDVTRERVFGAAMGGVRDPAPEPADR